jgi:hypothetical protein
MKNPTAMTTEELADELRKAEATARELGGNWQAEARLFRLRSELAFRRGKEADVADFPFVNEASQAERGKVLENDRKVRSTYHEHAQTDPALELGGRFKKLIPTSVTGSGPSPIPQQPSHSPWHHDPTGDEPPLGYSVEDHDAVGERHERAGSAVPVEPTNRMDTADGGPAAEELDRHVITPPVAGPTSSRGFRRRM